MSLLVSPPAIRLDRGSAAVRTLWFWPALLSSVALFLDAFWPLMPSVGARGFLWLDLAAAVALAVAVASSRTHDGKEWATAYDGRILAGFVLAILQVVATRGGDQEVLWLRQIAASGVCFYAIASRLRREPLAPDAVWPAFALIVMGLSAVTFGTLTQGTAAVAEWSRRLDLAWVSERGAGKLLLLGTVLCIGRAAEPAARSLWRAIAIVGSLATLVHWAVLGTGLSFNALTLLDEPFYFCNCIVSSLLLAGITQRAWALARERAHEAQRWRAAAVAFALVGVLLLLGGTTGGEGVRVLAALAGATVIAASLAPAKATARAPQANEPTVARAA